MRRLAWAIGGLALLVALGWVVRARLAPTRGVIETRRTLAFPDGRDVLDERCRSLAPGGVVEEPSPNVFIARGFDLANTIVVKTADGLVVFDPGISPAAAARTKTALFQRVSGPVRFLVYTHGHIDHVGGASAWVEPGTEIVATEALSGRFFEQYAAFRKAESMRGARQFGWHVRPEDLPCSGLGYRPNLDELGVTGARMPTRTFSGHTTIELGGVVIELHEAHGETDDQLFAWLPATATLLCGDNWYRAFPNLYTIRGTRPRPIDDWIASLDRMRRLDPAVLVPSHTAPVTTREDVRRELRDYRDAIQWVRDATVRLANEGRTPDEIAATVALPEHLARVPALEELYGQVDWSARAIYDNNLGWFDGRADRLYPLPPTERASRLVQLAGGPEAVLKVIEGAGTTDEHRFALELVALLRDSKWRPEPAVAQRIDAGEVRSLRALAATLANTNGRSYLLETAHEVEHGWAPLPRPPPTPELADTLPLPMLFELMALGLDPALAIDADESVSFRIGAQEWTVTVRHGVAEVVEGSPLPGNPAPFATVVADATTWRRVASRVEPAALAVAQGRLAIEGEVARFLSWFARFDRAG